MVGLGGVGVGIVVGWLLPVVHLARWQSVVASVAIVAIVVGALYLLAGVSGSSGGAIGIVGGAWLHGAFLENVAARTARTKEG
jgi:NhaP-type Na+/H+ or K+/H+ antiporter